MKTKSGSMSLFWACLFLTAACLISSTGEPDEPPHPSRHFTGLGLAVAGILLAAAGSRQEPEQIESPSSSMNNKYIVPCIVIMILAAGAVIRLIHLQSNPPQFWYDEANHGLDAILILEGNDRPLFFPSNCGQEPLFKYLSAGSILASGCAPQAIRRVSALAGWLTLIPFYFWIRTVCGNLTGIISTFFLAFSFWHVHFSRIGFRGILVPLFLVLTLYGIDSARIHGSKRLYFASGLAAGIGLSGYIAFRLAPLLLAFYLIWVCRDRIRDDSPPAGQWLWILPGFAIAVLPVAVDLWQNPHSFTSRIALTSLFSAPGNPTQNLLNNVHKHILFPITGGDPILRHGIPGRPPVSMVESILFGLGLGYAFSRLRESWAKAAVVFYFGMLVPGILSVPVQAPATLRVLGTSTAVYLLAGTGWNAIRRIIPVALRPAGLILLLLFSVSQNAWRHFELWPELLRRDSPARRSEFGFNQDEVSVAEYLNGKGNEPEEIYLSPQLRLHPTIRFLTWKKGSYKGIYRPEYFRYIEDPKGDLEVVLQLKKRNLWWLRNTPRKNFFWFWKRTENLTDGELQAMIRYCYPGETYLMHDSDEAILETLRVMYPEGTLKNHGDFWIYRVPLDLLKTENRRLKAK
ncbi:glycosyltransferase family 39 protein [bacterium]|nr:glycosyltransferase family 39 protein [candidate division CSSED10-310 bacterium]